MEINNSGYSSDYSIQVLSNDLDREINYIFQKDRKNFLSNKLNLEIPLKLEDYLILKVTNANFFSWIGKFEPGLEGISGIYATPSKDVVCIVLRGQGYWVPVNLPDNYEVIPCIPVKKVISVPKTNVMVFVDFVRLTAYNQKGFIWQTPSLSWDGLTINEVEPDYVHGIAWDSPNNSEVMFKVNVSDGTFTGGASPELD